MNKTIPALVALIPLAFAISGCDDTTTTSASSAAPTAAEQACLRDVTATANNPDVVLLGSKFSEAGTYVRVGVGENRAAWKCIAYKDGTTGGIEFLGEG